jgi:hypothetical protein
MQTLTVQITSNKGLMALHALEEKHFIRVMDNPEFGSPALPGQVMKLKLFRKWVSEAGNMPAVELKQAKAKWTSKRKQLLKLTK